MALTAAQTSVMQRDGWLGRLAPQRRAALLSAATVVVKPDGARIYATGDPPNGLWGVVDGRVRLLDYPRAGAEVLIRTLAPGEWFGELSTLDGGPRPQDAVASGTTTLAHIPAPVFARLAKATPELHHDIALLACAHQRAALAFIGQRVAQPIRARIAGALLAGAPPTGGMLATRQAEMAVIVGVSRQTLNRVLKGFEREGAIRIRYARIEILDVDRLEAACRRALEDL